MLETDERRRNRRMILPASLISGFICQILIISCCSGSFIHVNSAVVRPGQEFIIKITCIPSDPIQGYEYKLRYPSCIELLNATEGAFFDPEPQYLHFSGPEKDKAGNTVFITYGLIIGKGKTMRPGVLTIIRFRGIAPGSGSLEIYNIGIANVSGYLPVFVHNGTVQVVGMAQLISQGPGYSLTGSLVIIGFGIFTLLALSRRILKRKN